MSHDFCQLKTSLVSSLHVPHSWTLSDSTGTTPFSEHRTWFSKFCIFQNFKLNGSCHIIHDSISCAITCSIECIAVNCERSSFHRSHKFSFLRQEVDCLLHTLPVCNRPLCKTAIKKVWKSVRKLFFDESVETIRNKQVIYIIHKALVNFMLYSRTFAHCYY